MGKLLDVSAVLKAQEAVAQADYGLLDGHDIEVFGCTGIPEIVDAMQRRRMVHFFSDGAWSLHELVEALLRLTGPAAVWISTYAMSERSVRLLSAMKEVRMIRNLHVLLDNRIDTRTAGSLQVVMAIADEYALAPCHAKVTVLKGETHTITILGSANYTENKRMEAGLVQADYEAGYFHSSWIEK